MKDVNPKLGESHQTQRYNRSMQDVTSPYFILGVCFTMGVIWAFNYVPHIQVKGKIICIGVTWRKPPRKWGKEEFGIPHLSKGSRGRKQKCTQFPTPFSGTGFDALSHGVIHFVRSVSFKNLEMEVF